jgi:Spy/CpxP family protein refolding chaperone
MTRVFRIGLFLMASAILLPASATAQAGQGPRAARLRGELERRFAEQVQQNLGLTEDQAPKVGSILSTFAERRREAELSERQHRAGLSRQLRPGIAANADSVTAHVDGITVARLRYAELMQEEMTALSDVLTPVQRGQFFMLRDRILQRVQELRQQQQRPPS